MISDTMAMHILVILILLDFSVTFNTEDHAILIHKLVLTCIQR